MNAHAPALRHPRAPLPYQRVSPRSASPRYRQAYAVKGAKGAAAQREVDHRVCSRLISWRPASEALFSVASFLSAQVRELRIRTIRTAIDSSTVFRLTVAACGGAVITLAIINNHRADNKLAGYSVVRNETVVYRQTAARKALVEDDGEPAYMNGEDTIPAGYPRAVQTVKFVSSDSPNVPGFAGLKARVMEKVGAFIAFPGKKPADKSANADTEWPADHWRKGDVKMEQVDRYLWEVYQRAPTKLDHSGDFTWKDPAAAKRMGISMPEYVIAGMEPDFREQLYHAGQAMDAAGIQWSMLSGFRDDYRQSLAKGFKARVGNSLHGGSRATGGYGHGRAVDVTSADGEAEVVWKWLDANGAKYGLYRPIPGPDPAHVQSRGDWHKLAATLRETRVRLAEANGTSDRQTQPPKGKIAKASW